MDIHRKRRNSGTAGFALGVLFTALLFFVVLSGREMFGAMVRGQNPVKGLEVLTSDETREKMEEVRNILQENLLEDVDSQQLSDYLFTGIAQGLGDDYAAYYTPEELAEMKAGSSGEYKGIGCTLAEDADTGRLTIMEVYTESPADLAGLLPGDVLLAYGDQSLEGMDVSDVAQMIRRSEEPFRLTVYRDASGEELTVDLQCAEVHKDTVSGELREDQTGYLKITEFDEVTVGQFQETVERLRAEGMEKLVIDLRNNPGGLLDSVCGILDYIFPEGLLVYTVDRAGNRADIRSTDDHVLDLPIAVLINENSASASELFAGAVQDRERGPVIGTTSFGKGVVQQTYVLSDGSALKFTVQKYYTPNGTCIQGTGITPDIPVEESEESGRDAVYEKAWEVLNSNGTEDDIQRKAG